MTAVAVATDEKLMTADEFGALPMSRRPMELVRGRIVDMNVPGPRHGQICGNTVWIFQDFVKSHDIGHVLCNDSGIITEHDPDTVRGMDVSYYSYSRLPKGPLPAKYFDVVPELIVEVRSPDDRWSRILKKVSEYLEAGVTAVCVLDPKTETARLYSADETERTLQADELLTFPTILPGFAVPVRRFFE
ncbi:MAG: Uma2 family endonuclease [Planctomycetaceae bacterium]